MIVIVKQANNKEQQDIELDKSLKILKRKLIKEGTFQVLKEKRHYQKPSEIRHQKEMTLKHKRKILKRSKDKKKGNQSAYRQNKKR
ncbi:unnamed protein product [marine sediment metagenome]|uniref:30S ribosomal protein S21 n=1 Tax=marine sediment metagenome TaxID=412755 RepID=X0SV31_9ZZZZ